MLPDEGEQARLVELVVTDRLTVSVKPFRGATLIVELPLAPVLTVALVGLAEIIKSGDGCFATETETIAK